MVNGVLTTADLQAITQYERVGDIRRCLDEQGVPWFWGKDGIWTTLGLIEASKLRQAANQPAGYSPGIV